MKKYITGFALVSILLSLVACKNDNTTSSGVDRNVSLPDGTVFICQNGDRKVTFFEDRIIDSARPTDKDSVGQIFLALRTKQTNSDVGESGQSVFKQEFSVFDANEFYFYAIRSMQVGGGGLIHYSIYSPRHDFNMYCDQTKHSGKMAELSNFKWAATFDEDFQRNVKLQAEKDEAERAAREAQAKQEAEKRMAEAQVKQEAEEAKAKENQARHDAEMKKQREIQDKKQREAKIKSLF